MRGLIRRVGLLVIVVALVALFGSMTQADGPATSAENSSGVFSDVPSNHWSLNSLMFLYDRGVIEGLPNGQFQGDRAMTRYEVAAILTKALEYMEGQVGDLDLSETASEPDITAADLQVLSDLIFKISDRVQELSTEVDGIETAQPGMDPELANRIRSLESEQETIERLQAQLNQANEEIRTLKEQFTNYQISDSSVSEQDMQKTNQNILANRIIAIFSFAAALAAIGLLTLR